MPVLWLGNLAGPISLYCPLSSKVCLNWNLCLLFPNIVSLGFVVRALWSRLHQAINRNGKNSISFRKTHKLRSVFYGVLHIDTKFSVLKWLTRYFKGELHADRVIESKTSTSVKLYNLCYIKMYFARGNVRFSFRRHLPFPGPNPYEYERAWERNCYGFDFNIKSSLRKNICFLLKVYWVKS